MPIYNYRARTLLGEERQGQRDARDLPMLGHLLREEGLLLIEARAEKSRGPRSFSIPFLSRISLSDRMMATRHLSVLIDAGVDLPRALGTLGRQTKNQTFKDALSTISEEIRRGQRLSDALRPYPKIFSELYVAMIAAGEESGNMVESLRGLAAQLEKQHKLRSRIKGAMTYPAIIIIAMMIIGVLMFIYVIPQLESVFGDLTVQLPPQTRFIFWLSHALLKQWYFFLGGFVAFVFVFRYAWTSHRGTLIRDAILMRLPVFKDLLREIASAFMARTLSSLISAGVPIVRALEITSRVVGNAYFRDSLQEASRMIEKGKPIHETLEQYSWVYPPLVIEMAAVGEQSGKLAEVLADLADFYEGEVDQRTQALSSIVEPILMLFIGSIVGFFVISIMQPMYSLINNF